MAKVTNDQELRNALDALSEHQRRLLGAQFAANVIRLSHEPRLSRAIEVGLDPNAAEDELQDAYRAAKSHATKTYTDCGKDTDWLAQAEHFVAEAAAAALTPTELQTERANVAWKAAMQARMAENCELMEAQTVAAETEVERQYRIINENLGAS